MLLVLNPTLRSGTPKFKFFLNFKYLDIYGGLNLQYVLGLKYCWLFAPEITLHIYFVHQIIFALLTHYDFKPRMSYHFCQKIKSFNLFWYFSLNSKLTAVSCVMSMRIAMLTVAFVMKATVVTVKCVTVSVFMKIQLELL